MLLTPCLGGDVDQAKFPHAPDVAEGRLDVYGQLDPNYVQQSAPHMKAIGAMMRRVVGSPSPPSPRPVQPLPPGKSKPLSLCPLFITFPGEDDACVCGCVVVPASSDWNFVRGHSVHRAMRMAAKSRAVCVGSLALVLVPPSFLGHSQALLSNERRHWRPPPPRAW